MMIKKIYLLVAILSLLSVSCIHINTKPGETLKEKLAANGYETEKEVNHVNNYQIDSWSNLDSYGIIRGSSVNKMYLVTFTSACQNLNWSGKIGTTSTAGGLTRFDEVLVSGPGGMVDRCHIDKIFLLKKLKKKQEGEGSTD